MDSMKTHKDWALIEEWERRAWERGDYEVLWISTHGVVCIDAEHSPIVNHKFPLRALSEVAKAKCAAASLALRRVRQLEKQGLIILDEASFGISIEATAAWEEASYACNDEAREKLRTAPKSSAIGRLRSRIIQAVPELFQLYEARELAAAAKKRKPVATTQRGRL